MERSSMNYTNGTNHYHKEHVNGQTSSSQLSKKAECTKTSMNVDITSPAEDYYVSLVGQLTKLSMQLVEKKMKRVNTCHPQCRMLEEKQGWRFAEDLHKCAGIHLKHCSDYHQFHIECLEDMAWMKDDVMNAGQYLADVQPYVQQDELELNNFLEKTKELCRILMYWRVKLMELKNKSEVLVPVHLRADIHKELQPIRCIHTFEDSQGVMREGEDLVLLDNTSETNWKVRTHHGHEFYAPSTFLVILGPAHESQLEVVKLIETYGELWTVLRGLAKKALINLVCCLVEACDGYDEQSWMSMPAEKLEKIVAIVKLMEDMFGVTWCSQRPGMKDRVDQLKNILMKSINREKNIPENRDLLRQMLVKNPELIQDLLNLFQESWSDKNKFWASKTSNVCRAVEKFEDDQEFEAVYAIEEVYKLTRAKETTESSHLTTSQQEEKQTFVITGVVNPKSKKMVSLDEAICLGIINQKEGKYIGGLDPKYHIPIPEAMNEQLIKVEFTKKQVFEEKKNDFGFVTIKSYVETKPYTIRMVVNPDNNSQMTLEEAVKKGILDQKQNVYRNLKTKMEMSFEEALEKNLLIVDFADVDVKEDQSNGAESISYAVYCALDTRSGKWLNFKEAVEQELLNADEGTYIDRSSQHQFKLVQAIEKGLIRATKVTDPKTIELLSITDEHCLN